MQQVEENTIELWRSYFPDLKKFSHKYERGQGVFLGGSNMTGAICLSADAATRTGLGVAHIYTSAKAADIYKIYRPHFIVSDHENNLCIWLNAIRDERTKVAVIGPGFGKSDFLKEVILSSLESDTKLVLDADALRIFSESADVFFNGLKQHEHSILTPHRGEFYSIFPDESGDILLDTIKAAQDCGSTIVHKGETTYVVTSEGRVGVYENSQAYVLATAGTGDVLTGILAALIALGMDSFMAANAAVWIHGQAAETIGTGLVAADIPRAIPEVLKTHLNL